MKSFKEYISKNNINESLLLTCLAAGFASWGIKTTFKTAEGIKDKSETLSFIWDTLFESKKTNNKNLVFEEEQKKIKLTADKIKPIQIPDDKVLIQAIKATKPSLGKDGNGTGLFTIAEKIKKNKDFGHIDKSPYHMNYAAFVTEDKQICGMFGFSIEFWKAILKNNDKFEKIAKSFKNSLHIFDMQICPEFDEKPIYDVIWNTFEKMIKELKVSQITIHYDNKEEKEIYIKHGFKEIDGLDDYLVLTKNKEKS